MQIIIGGIIMGCIYALTAIGLVLIYRTTEVVNFAHGEMAMITTFISYIFLSRYDLPYFISFLLAILFAIFFSFIIYQFFMRRVQDAPHLNQIVLTLGLFLLLNGLASLIWGYQPSAFPEAITSSELVHLFNVYITKNEIFIIFITFLLIVIFFLLFRYTKVGMATRATAQSIVNSELMGINVTNIFLIVWTVSAVLGGIAGILTAPMTFLSPNMMFDIIILAFAAAVLGGFISLIGTIIGGLIIGVFENLVSYFISPDMKIVFVFLLIVTILYIRPQGILGEAKQIKKV
jgi:branched-chain amino acid transport system permease protein